MADSPKNDNANSERRRSSGAQKFAKLHAFKRDPNNEAAAQRRSSLTDQMQKPGVLGQMWNNWTRGPSNPK